MTHLHSSLIHTPMLAGVDAGSGLSCAGVCDNNARAAAAWMVDTVAGLEGVTDACS